MKFYSIKIIGGGGYTYVFFHFNIDTSSKMWGFFSSHMMHHNHLIALSESRNGITQKFRRPVNSCNCFKVTFVWIAMLCNWGKLFQRYLDSHISCNQSQCPKIKRFVRPMVFSLTNGTLNLYIFRENQPLTVKMHVYRFYQQAKTRLNSAKH